MLQKFYRVGPQLFCGIFCEIKLTEIWNTRSPRLHWPHNITRSSVESVLAFTLHISLLVSQNAGNTHRVISRPACCLSYVNDKHWPLRNVHFVNTDLWDTAKLHRIMSIAMYDYSLCWRAMTTNKNKSEPSMSLCQDLVDFIPFVSFLELVDHIMAG